MKLFKISLHIVLISLISFSCSINNKEFKYGPWRGAIFLDKNDMSLELPFNFTLEKSEEGKFKAIITNAGENIIADEITFSNDSILIKMPVFQDEIRAKIINGDSLTGEYFHFGSRNKYGMQFYASAGIHSRFPNAKQTPVADISGRWETIFQSGESDEYKAVGEFKQTGNYLSGTFLTTTGDFRYLEGAVSGNIIMLSGIDGAHSLLFKANISPQGTLENGILCGGPTWRERWRAVRNDNAKLPDPEKISALKEGINVINFSLPALNNKKVSFGDTKYKGKAVIIQIMGSWCPNCMDETRLFTQMYEYYKPKGLEIIALCFESKDIEESNKRIDRFVKQLNAKYDFYYAGEVGNKNVLEVLKFMKEFKGYPTTIYLDRNHQIKSVYTGFSGPGTGMYYEKQKYDIIQIIEKILNTTETQKK